MPLFPTKTPDELQTLEREILDFGYLSSRAGFAQRNVGANNRELLREWLIGMGCDPTKAKNASDRTLATAFQVGEKYIDGINRNDSTVVRTRNGLKTVDWRLENVDLDLNIPEGFGSIFDSGFDKPIDSSTIDPAALARAADSVITPRLNAAIKSLTDQVATTIKAAARAEIDSEKSSLIQTMNTLVHDFKTLMRTELEVLTRDTATSIAEDKARKIATSTAESIIFDRFISECQLVQGKEVESEAKSIDPSSHTSYVPRVDPSYYFDPYASRVIRKALAMRENLYVYGDTGCGKTTHLEQVCAVMGRGLSRINPHDGATREMFLGGMKLINGETVFVEGALPRAMRLGLVFLVDEYSFLPPNLAAVMNPVLETGGKLYIPETSEWIAPAPGFCVFATDNTGGKGDRTGQYTGIEIQNTATLDRFSFCLRMDYLPREKEQEMLEKRFPTLDRGELSQILSLALDIRSAFSRGELAVTLSTRKLIKFFDQRANGFSTTETLHNILLNWLDEDDKQLVSVMLDRLDIRDRESEATSPDPTTNLGQFIHFIQTDQKVLAIGLYRLVRNIGLKEAMDEVESIIAGGLPVPTEKDDPQWTHRFEGFN